MTTFCPAATRSMAMVWCATRAAISKVKPLRRSLHLLPQLPDDVLFAGSSVRLHGVVVSSTGDFARCTRPYTCRWALRRGGPCRNPGKALLCTAAAGSGPAPFSTISHGKRRGERADVVGVVVILLQRSGGCNQATRDLDSPSSLANIVPGVWALIWLASRTSLKSTDQTMTSNVKAWAIIWLTLASWGTPSGNTRHAVSGAWPCRYR